MTSAWRVWIDRFLGRAGDPAQASDTIWIRDDSPFWTGITVWTTAIGLIAASLLVGLMIRESGGDGSAAAMQAQHITRATLGEACDGAVGASVPFDVEVDPNGLVTRATSEGRRDAAQRCLEEHVRSWQFAPQAQPTTLHLVLTVDP